MILIENEDVTRPTGFGGMPVYMSLQGPCFSLTVLVALLWKNELDPCEPNGYVGARYLSLISESAPVLPWAVPAVNRVSF